MSPRMTLDQVAAVLAKVQLGDNRQVDRTVLAFWAEAIGDQHYDDALQAVTLHRREQPGVWLEPGHIISGARRAKEAREREERMNRPAIESQPIVLDRAAHEADAAYWVQYYREHPDER